MTTRPSQYIKKIIKVIKTKTYILVCLITNQGLTK